MFKKILKIITTVILVLLIFMAIPIFIPDEEYSPGAQQWLDEANTVVELPPLQNSFNALVGFSLKEGSDFVSEGATMAVEVNRRTKLYRKVGDKKPAVDPRWEGEGLKLTKEWRSLTNTVFEDNPISWLKRNQKIYKKHLSENKVLLERYRKITTIKKYSNYMIPDINAPFLPLYGFISTSKLNDLSVIHDFIRGKQKRAIKRLTDSIHYSRLMMRESRFLINKMIALAVLRNNLQTYTILQDSNVFRAEFQMNIENLDKNERTMHRAFRGEFAFMSSVFHPVNIKSESLLPDGSNVFGNIRPFFEDLYVNFYLKPRKLENMAYKYIWIPFLDQESMTFEERKNQNADEFDQSTWWDYYIDPVGTFLFGIAIPAYNRYFDNVDHLDALISLLSIKDEIKNKKIKSEEIEKFIAKVDLGNNPGYADATILYNKNTDMLTFNIPGYSDDAIPAVKMQ